MTGGDGNKQTAKVHGQWTGTGIASEARMAITEQQKRMLAVTAVGAGLVLAAQMWRRRDPYVFAGRSVLTPGGSRALGLVLAPRLADEGARLPLVPRDEGELRRAVEDIESRQPFAQVLPPPADIRARYQAERAIAMAVER